MAAAAVDRSGPDSDGPGGPDGGGEKMGGGVLHLSIFAYIKTHSRGKGGGREVEGERLIFHANRPLMEETNLLSALSRWS